MDKLKRVIVTNDDGIDAPGLAAATAIAESIAEEVWVIAPLGDQSGVGQGISMHTPLRLTRYGTRRYALSGTPADCVMYAMAEFFADEPPDLVLSGVNWGANLSDSVMCSGTVGAVLADDHLDLPSIALSQAFDDRGDVDFSPMRTYARSVIEMLWDRRDELRCCWNINVQMQTPEKIHGLRFTRQIGGAIRAPRLIEGADGRGLAYHWLTFERDTTSGVDKRSDVVALREDYISAMPLRRIAGRTRGRGRGTSAGASGLSRRRARHAVRNRPRPNHSSTGSSRSARIYATKELSLCSTATMRYGPRTCRAT